MANNYGKKVVEVKKEKTEVMFQVGTVGDIPQILNPIREIKKYGKTYRVYNKKEYQERLTKLKETLNVINGVIRDVGYEFGNSLKSIKQRLDSK